MARMDVRGAFAMGVSSNGRTLATLHAGVPGQGTHGGAMVQVWDMESIPAKIMNTLPLADLVPKSHASCLSHVSYQATMVVKGEDMGIVGATWQHMVCTFPLKAGMERGRIITDCKYPVHVATDGVQVTVCNWSKPWFQVFNADLEVVFAGRVRGTSKPMHVRFVDKARALVLGRDRQIHLMCTRTWTVVWSRPMSIAMPECVLGHSKDWWVLDSKSFHAETSDGVVHKQPVALPAMTSRVVVDEARDVGVLVLREGVIRVLQTPLEKASRNGALSSVRVAWMSVVARLAWDRTRDSKWFPGMGLDGPCEGRTRAKRRRWGF